MTLSDHNQLDGVFREPRPAIRMATRDLSTDLYFIPFSCLCDNSYVWKATVTALKIHAMKDANE